MPVADVWRDAIGTEPPPEIAAGPYLRLSPLQHGTDGFFAAAHGAQGSRKVDENLPRDGREAT